MLRKRYFFATVLVITVVVGWIAHFSTQLAPPTKWFSTRAPSGASVHFQTDLPVRTSKKSPSGEGELDASGTSPLKIGDINAQESKEELDSDSPSGEVPYPKVVATIVPRIIRDDEALAPSLKALKDLEAETENIPPAPRSERATSSDTIFNVGAGTSSGTGTAGGGIATLPTPSPSGSVSATPFLELLGGQARGYVMLYLMHPNARATVLREVDILKHARVEDVYLAVLTDGTFGKDFSFLADVVRSLSSEGRSLTLEIYLTNGSTQRNYSISPIPGGFNDIDPVTFRRSIRFDPVVRGRFRQLVDETISVVDLVRSLNPKNRVYLSVMLEDNLDLGAYRAMRALAVERIGNRVTFIRNPCISDGCVVGGDMDSAGDPLEYHAPVSISEVREGYGYTLDGAGVYFDGETTPLDTYSVSQTVALAAEAYSRGAAYFGLWRYERQGLQHGKVNPDDRLYEVPSEQQETAEISILRAGLPSAASSAQ